MVMPAVELLPGFDVNARESENETNKSATIPQFHFSKWNKTQIMHTQLE